MTIIPDSSLVMLLNLAAPYIGLIICGFAWVCTKINTKPITIQLTYIMYIICWIFVYLMDSASMTEVQPTYMTICARWAGIFALTFTTLYVRSITKYVQANDNLTMDNVMNSVNHNLKDPE